MTQAPHVPISVSVRLLPLYVVVLVRWVDGVRPALEVHELHERVGVDLDVEEVDDEPPDWGLEMVCGDGPEGAVEKRRGPEKARVPITDTFVSLSSTYLKLTA